MNWKTVTLFLLISFVSNWLKLSSASISAGCQCVTYQSSSDKHSGIFTSPNYPQPYRDGISCILYVFVAPSHRKLVEVMFEDLDLGEISEFNNCNNGDRLRVYLDQPSPFINEEAMFNTQICGQTSRMLSRKFYSTTGVLILELETDKKNRTHRGFKGTYSFLNSKDFETTGVRQTDCTYIMNAGRKDGRLFSPKYPQNYPHLSNCQWIFRGDLDERVYLTFVKIQLSVLGLANHSTITDNIIPDDVSRTCDFNERHNDIITVYDGDSNQAPVLGLYCGSTGPKELRSTAGKMLVTFTSNQYGAAAGFAAIFKFVKQKPEDEVFSCDQTVKSDRSKQGIFSSPTYPQFRGSRTCVYEFYGEPSERVVIKFQQFDLGGGGISSKNCSRRDSVTVIILVNGTYPYTLKIFCGSQRPLNLMSNGPYLKIKFEAITWTPGTSKFQFRYQFVKDFGITADLTPHHILPCANEYHADVKTEGEVVSPNYGGYYPQETLCSYYFYGKGRKVKIEFKELDVSGEPPWCLEKDDSDYVALSNFNGAEDGTLGRFCSDQNEASPILGKSFVSDGDFFQITFKSGLKGNGTGFRAVYKFIEHEAVQDEQVLHTSGASSKSCNFLSKVTLFIWLAVYSTSIITSI
ncbi:suppressor of lurcher protein 1-like [Watersipora subatra]|uniref:suppressor of lurcher protein 1-like n=1 Tax=Watersipora subatra TaxID=2589382 RepID=UPI00355B2ECD